MNQNQRNSAIIFRKNPSPAGAPLLPDLLRYQTPAVLYIYGCAFDALRLPAAGRS